jgi:hypothetical protein
MVKLVISLPRLVILVSTNVLPSITKTDLKSHHCETSYVAYTKPLILSNAQSKG